MTDQGPWPPCRWFEVMDISPSELRQNWREHCGSDGVCNRRTLIISHHIVTKSIPEDLVLQDTAAVFYKTEVSFVCRGGGGITV